MSVFLAGVGDICFESAVARREGCERGKKTTELEKD